MLLMLCDQCALEALPGGGGDRRGAAGGNGRGRAGRLLPDVYAALAGAPPDHVITL